MKKTAIALALLGLANSAFAATQNYSFNDVQDGVSGDSLGTSRSVASLSVTDTISDLGGFAKSVTFSLTNTFTNSLVLPGVAKVSSLVFSSGDVAGLGITHTPSGFAFRTSQTDLAGGKNSTFDFGDYRVVFNTAAASSFGNGETASWTIYGGNNLDVSDFSGFLLQVNGTGGYRNEAGLMMTNAGTSSIHFAAAPVPEPESYAMFLAGLGIMGAIARRRKIKA